MDFAATVQGQQFSISSIGKDAFLVSGSREQYIIYRKGNWQCADEIPAGTLRALGQAIDAQGFPANDTPERG